MQENTITLSVDVANNSTLTNEVLLRHEQTPNRTEYIHEDHTISMRKLMHLYRTAPKRNGESRGASKSSVKFTFDREVPNATGDGNLVLPQIVEVSFSIPVGCSEAQTMELRQYVVALLDTDAVSGALNDLLEI